MLFSQTPYYYLPLFIFKMYNKCRVFAKMAMFDSFYDEVPTAQNLDFAKIHELSTFKTLACLPTTFTDDKRSS